MLMNSPLFYLHLGVITGSHPCEFGSSICFLCVFLPNVSNFVFEDGKSRRNVCDSALTLLLIGSITYHVSKVNSILVEKSAYC